jgi:hypothetical protein
MGKQPLTCHALEQRGRRHHADLVLKNVKDYRQLQPVLCYADLWLRTNVEGAVISTMVMIV